MLGQFAHGTEQLWTVGETAALQREPQNVNMHVNMNYEGRRRSIIVSRPVSVVFFYCFSVVVQQCQSRMFLTLGAEMTCSRFRLTFIRSVPISHAARVEVRTAAAASNGSFVFLAGGEHLQ